MKHTWTTISDERNNAHNKVEKILASSKKTSSFIQEYKKAAGAAMFGLVLLFASLIVPKTSMYQASLEIPQVPGITLEDTEEPENLYGSATIDEAIDFEDEAQEIEIEPLPSTSNTEDSEASNEVDFEEIDENSNIDIPEPDPSFNIATSTTEKEIEEPTPKIDDIDTPVVSEVEPNKEINIFESIENETIEKESTQEASIDDNFPVAPLDTYNPNENFYSAAPDFIDTPASPFKENTHTYNKVSEPIVNVGNIKDPLNQETPKNIETEEIIDNPYETLHEAARIVKIQQKAKKTDSLTGTHIFTGKLQPSKPTKNAKYQFAFLLELEDETRMRINTNRDLRSVLGQTLSIEIEGTKNKFTLKHVYYKASDNNKQLVQSGPQSLMIFTAILAFIVSFLYSRPRFKS